MWRSLFDEDERRWWELSVFLVLLVPFILLLMDRPLICTCGSVKLWFGNVHSPEISQHLTDWYVFSHIIHGFLSYMVMQWLFPERPVIFWAVLAILVEGIWEVAENTPYVIEYYRAHTMSTEFVGDTVLNSTMDVLAMISGFVMARRFPIWVTVVLFVGFELMTIILIRDGFLLNVLMFVWPLEAVKEWQMEIAAMH